MTMKLGVREEPAIYKVLASRMATERRSLRSLGRWSGGGTPSKSNPAFWSGGTIPWVSPKDMKPARISDAEDHITPEAVAQSATSLIKAGSVLLVVRSGILQHSLPVAVTDVDVALNQDLKALQPSAGVDATYVAWALRAHAQAILHLCTKAGTTVQSIEMPALLDYEIPLPSPARQRAIVETVEARLSVLDASVAALHRVQANLKRYRASVLKSACEGRLVPTEAELARQEGRTFETGVELLKRLDIERLDRRSGKGYKEPAIPAFVVPELPVGWSCASLDQLCDPIVDCPHSTARFEKSGHPCIDTNWMTKDGLAVERARFVSYATYVERVSRLTPIAGDIVFAREGTIGTAVIIPLGMQPCLGQRVMLLRSSPSVLSKYLVLALHSDVVIAQYRDQALGSTVPHINVRDVKRFAIPLPPLAEQHRIVAEADRRLSLTRVAEAQVAVNLGRAKRLRQSILQAAFAAPASA